MQKNKILVIEDTLSLQEELKEILTFEGYNIYTANNGQEGIDTAINIIPDLILCDVMMPFKDGFQVLHELQHDVILKDIPFVFLTSMTAKENVKKAMKKGATDYITKPIDIDLLIVCIKKVILG